jgi:hypothetical protein
MTLWIERRDEPADGTTMDGGDGAEQWRMREQRGCGGDENVVARTRWGGEDRWQRGRGGAARTGGGEGAAARARHGGIEGAAALEGVAAARL